MRKEHTSVEFTINGKNYIIDLSDENAAEFNKALAPYIEHARRARATKKKTASHKPRSSSEASRIKRQKSAQIRAWALENGITVAKRGMLNQSVIDAYETAHVAQNTDTATDDQ
jgi:hypothetical protein